MTLKDILLFIIGSITSLGVLAAGIGYLMGTARKKERDEKTEVVSSADQVSMFWKDQANEYKEMMKIRDEKNDGKVKDLTSEVNLLTKEVGELRGQLNAEKTQNERYEKIFQGRSPEQEEFMKFMIQATKDQAESHKGIMEVLNKVYKFAEMEHDRDFTVTAKVTKDGDGK